MIVFGGTLGAILIQYPLAGGPPRIQAAGARIRRARSRMRKSTIAVAGQICQPGRREGLISLDKEIATIQEPFLRRALMLAVDGTESQELRKIMELELDNKEEQEEKIPQLFESAGGFSPTIGIIGAVLGLIQVMQHLGQDRRGRARDRRCLRRHHLWSWRRQPLLFAGGRKAENPHSRRADHSRDDARGRHFHPRRNEPAHAGSEAAGIPDAGSRCEAGPEIVPTHEPPQKTPALTSITIAGWFPMPISSPCCLLFLSCSMLRPRSIRERSGSWRWRSRSLFRRWGFFEASTTHVPIDLAEPMPFSSVQAIENMERTGSVARITSHPDGTLGGGAENGDLAQLQAELETLWLRKSSARKLPCAAIRTDLVISLQEAGFFESGAAQIKSTSQATFDQIANMLLQRNCRVRIEGHTDNIPIHNSLFSSNWELSTARATEIVRLLIVRYGFNPARLSAAGFAEYHPIASNATADGRGTNRRVDIVILRHEPLPDPALAVATPAAPATQAPSPVVLEPTAQIKPVKPSPAVGRKPGPAQ